MQLHKRKKLMRNIPSAKSLSFEQLEDRHLLAITWGNEFDTGIDAPNFDVHYGPNEAIARSTVNRAIADWNRIVLDQNYDLDSIPNTGLELRVIAGNLATLINRPSDRGATQIDTFSQAVNPSWKPEVPVEATVFLDDNAVGFGWFFDMTPNDDAEFTALANADS